MSSLESRPENRNMYVMRKLKPFALRGGLLSGLTQNEWTKLARLAYLYDMGLQANPTQDDEAAFRERIVKAALDSGLSEDSVSVAIRVVDLLHSKQTNFPRMRRRISSQPDGAH